MTQAATQDQRCSHDIFLKGKCKSCNLHRVDCREITTVPFNYFHSSLNMSLNLTRIDQFRDLDLGSILRQKKLNLILDLDNTLLHTRKAQKLVSADKQDFIGDKYELYEIENGSHLVKLRPGAREFLKKAGAMFKLSIYTMGSRDYAQRMAKLLSGPCPSMFGKRIISREDCTEVGQKGLDVVLSDKRVVLIVDDREDVWEESCRANLVKIAPYRFSGNLKIKRQELEEFTRVLNILTLVHRMFYEDYNEDEEYMNRDVRRILKRVRDHKEQKNKEVEVLADQLAHLKVSCPGN